MSEQLIECFNCGKIFYSDTDAPDVNCWSCAKEAYSAKFSRTQDSGFYLRKNAARELNPDTLADYLKEAPRRPSGIELDVLHHSGESTYAYRGLETWLTLQDYHIRGKGWVDIGYHFGIGPDGKIFLGRNIYFAGDHSGAQIDKISIGICLLGDFNQEMVPPVQRRAYGYLANLCASTYGYTQHTGHRWVGIETPDCPGTYISLALMRKWLASSDSTWEQLSVPESMSLGELDLTPKIIQNLELIGIDTLDELLTKTDEEILRIKGIGVKTLDSIKEQLKERGLSLKTGG